MIAQKIDPGELQTLCGLHHKEHEQNAVRIESEI